jgi:hypothetical protein
MSRQIFGVMLILVAIPPAIPVQAMEQNTDRPGQNYRNFDLDTPDPTQCRNACLEEGGCKAWTYVKPGTQGPKARCWLKTGVPAATTNSCCVSGVKRAPAPETGANVDTTTKIIWHYGDRPGGNYKSFDVEEDNALACDEACNKDERCRSWVYVRPGYQGPKARCWLKDSVPPMVSDMCCKTSVKVTASSGAGTTQQGTPTTCIPLSITSQSPLPPAVIGGQYSYQFQTSGGVMPVTFCALAVDPRGAPPSCDTSPGQRFSLPAGLTLSPGGLLSGQLKCLNPEQEGTNCGAGYRPILIRANDHCPKGSQTATQEFWIDIKQN